MKKRGSLQARFWIILSLFFLEFILFIMIILFLIFNPFDEKSLVIPIILIYCFQFFLVLFIANTQAEASFKISWLLVIIVLPLIGGIIYLLFSNKITTKRMKNSRINVINEYMLYYRPDSTKVLKELGKENPSAAIIAHYLYRNAYCGVYKNTETTYFELGEIGAKSMIEELKKAKKYIFIEYFIMQSGDFFDAIFDVLKDKAAAGLDVRLLYDDFGCSSKVSSFFYKEVRNAGIRCFPFNIMRPFLDIRQNNRNHRKILVIDGNVGFTGGINLADEYINKGSKYGLWKDNCVMIKGNAVDGLMHTFLADWGMVDKKITQAHNLEESQQYSYSKNKNLDLREVKECKGYVVPYYEQPFDGEETARNVFLQMISRANKSIYISTPYLILDEELKVALGNAAKSGIDVRIVCPGTPDKKIVYSCTRSYYNLLAINGVKIYEYTPGFNHEKMIVVDNIMAATGSINFDFRSLYLNYENGIFFYGVDEISKMNDDLLKMFADSKEIEYAKYLEARGIKKLWWAVLRIFATLF